jgi:glyoxylase-like metal-dependent hydrolase (beta-lactamase superfamily II)
LKNTAKIYEVICGMFKLDGGAMFGVVPRSIWEKLNQPDNNNLCSWAMRSILIEDGNRKILVDCGMGNKQTEKFFSYYEPYGEKNIFNELNHLQIAPESITDVILTHLHFDHCGGAIAINEMGNFYYNFPNATFWSNEKHWQWAVQPNAREKASFLKENILPIKDLGQLKFVETPVNTYTSFENPVYFTENVQISFAVGHTDYMMLPQINTENGLFIFGADLFPSPHHVAMPWVMAYDTRPLQTLEDKTAFFKFAEKNEIKIIFEHDKDYTYGTIKQTDRGFKIDNLFQTI